MESRGESREPSYKAVVIGQMKDDGCLDEGLTSEDEAIYFEALALQGQLMNWVQSVTKDRSQM